jgi:hypothetical protein
MYDFLFFHEFKEPITINPMWLILVGESMVLLTLLEDEAVGHLS